MPFLRSLTPGLLSALLFAACSAQSPEAHLASAKQYLEKRETSAAIIELRSALQQRPDLAEGRFLFGKLLLDSGEAGAAAIELRKAWQSGYPDADVVPLLAKAMLLQRQHKALVDEFAATTLEPAAAMADLTTTLAAAYVAMGRATEGEAALGKALSTAPDYPPARLLQARLAAAKGDLEGATRIVAAVLEARPTDVDAWKTKGDLLRAGKDEQSALAAYRKAIEFDPENADAHAGAAEILLRGDDTEAARKQIERMKMLARQHPQTRYLEARLAFVDKDDAKVRSLLEQVLRLAPDHVPALELAGVTELRAGSPVKARGYLGRALQLAPHQIATRRLLAEADLRLGNPQGALDTLQPVLGRFADARSLALAAQAHLHLGDAKRAQALFSRAAELNPDDVLSRTHMAVAKMDQGKVDAGIQELERLASSDAGTSADMALIAAHLARGEREAARKAIDRLEGKVENKAIAANLRGRALLLLRDVKGARESFERAASLDPKFYIAIASLATLDAAEGKLEEARKRYEGVLQADPKHVGALLALADLKAREPGGREEARMLIERAVKAEPADVVARLSLVEHHLASRQPKLALTAAQDAAAVAADDPRILGALGRAQMAAGDHNQAVSTYRRLATLQPKSPRVLARLAEAELAMKDSQSARESSKRALAASPTDPVALRTMAMVELKSNRPQEALALARRLQKQRPKDAGAVALEGDAELLLRHHDAAAAAYRRSLKLTPASEVAVKLHSLLRTTGKSEEAARFSADWLSKNPADARFLYHLGDVALMRGDYGQAEARYREVLAAAPDNFLALNNVAWTMVRQNKQGAVEFAEKASRLRVNDPSLMDTLALALAHDKQFDRAIKVQVEAVRLQPENALLRLNLARIYMVAGRKDEARAELKGLAALGQSFQGQSEVARMLETLNRS